MVDQHDDVYAPKCYDLVYDHCIAGYQDPKKIPANILAAMPSVLAETWAVTGKNQQSDFHGEKPTQYTRVCVAKPNVAGCTNPKAGAYRVHMKGYRSPGYTECDKKPNDKLIGTSYVKIHVDSSNRVLVRGKVGK